MGKQQAKSSRMTRQQAAIVDLLGSAKRFSSAQQIYWKLLRRNKEVALATVYRTLKSLVESGEVDVIFSDGEALYRLCKSADHHHHLVCRDCGTSIEIENPEIEAWTEKVAEKHGFEAVGHTLELYGTCRRCFSRA
jgi:Fur family ferric uptake transcriptional regulator